LTSFSNHFVFQDEDEEEEKEELRYEGAGIDRDLIDLLERDIVQKDPNVR
jgi:hypothetical protein